MVPATLRHPPIHLEIDYEGIATISTSQADPLSAEGSEMLVSIDLRADVALGFHVNAKRHASSRVDIVFPTGKGAHNVERCVRVHMKSLSTKQDSPQEASETQAEIEDDDSETRNDLQSESQTNYDADQHYENSQSHGSDEVNGVADHPQESLSQNDLLSQLLRRVHDSNFSESTMMAPSEAKHTNISILNRSLESGANGKQSAVIQHGRRPTLVGPYIAQKPNAIATSRLQQSESQTDLRSLNVNQVTPVEFKVIPPREHGRQSGPLSGNAKKIAAKIMQGSRVADQDGMLEEDETSSGLSMQSSSLRPVTSTKIFIFRKSDDILRQSPVPITERPITQELTGTHHASKDEVFTGKRNSTGVQHHFNQARPLRRPSAATSKAMSEKRVNQRKADDEDIYEMREDSEGDEKQKRKNYSGKANSKAKAEAKGPAKGQSKKKATPARLSAAEVSSNAQPPSGGYISKRPQRKAANTANHLMENQMYVEKQTDEVAFEETSRSAQKISTVDDRTHRRAGQASRTTVTEQASRSSATKHDQSSPIPLSKEGDSAIPSHMHNTANGIDLQDETGDLSESIEEHNPEDPQDPLQEQDSTDLQVRVSPKTADNNLDLSHDAAQKGSPSQHRASLEHKDYGRARNERDSTHVAPGSARDSVQQKTSPEDEVTVDTKTKVKRPDPYATKLNALHEQWKEFGKLRDTQRMPPPPKRPQKKKQPIKDGNDSQNRTPTNPAHNQAGDFYEESGRHRLTEAIKRKVNSTSIEHSTQKKPKHAETNRYRNDDNAAETPQTPVNPNRKASLIAWNRNGPRNQGVPKPKTVSTPRNRTPSTPLQGENSPAVAKKSFDVDMTDGSSEDDDFEPFQNELNLPQPGTKSEYQPQTNTKKDKLSEKDIKFVPPRNTVTVASMEASKPKTGVERARKALMGGSIGRADVIHQKMKETQIVTNDGQAEAEKSARVADRKQSKLKLSSQLKTASQMRMGPTQRIEPQIVLMETMQSGQAPSSANDVVRNKRASTHTIAKTTQRQLVDHAASQTAVSATGSPINLSQGRPSTEDTSDSEDESELRRAQREDRLSPIKKSQLPKVHALGENLVPRKVLTQSVDNPNQTSLRDPHQGRRHNQKQIPSSPTEELAFTNPQPYQQQRDGTLLNIQTNSNIAPKVQENPFVNQSRRSKDVPHEQSQSIKAAKSKNSDPAKGTKRPRVSLNPERSAEDPDKTLVPQSPHPKRRKTRDFPPLQISPLTASQRSLQSQGHIRGAKGDSPRYGGTHNDVTLGLMMQLTYVSSHDVVFQQC